jgi:mannose-1-phosphate guanylyltransferase
MTKKTDLHAIILADGHDHSLKPLVEALEGTDIPKQLACIAGQGSLLQQTVRRYAGLVAPERMIVVVPAAFEALARSQLRVWRGISIMGRPEHPTGQHDLLLPLGYLLARAPCARVLVTPAHHYLPYPEAIVAALAAAHSALEQVPLVVLGVPSGHRRTTHGWILQGKSMGNGLSSVAGFVEDSSHSRSTELAMAGALWSIETGVGNAEHLWNLASRQAPLQAEAVARFWSSRQPSIKDLSRGLLNGPAVELSGPLLRLASNVAIVAAHGSGWTDWTSTEHVIDSINNPREMERLLSRIWDKQIAQGRTELRHRHPTRHRHASAA